MAATPLGPYGFPDVYYNNLVSGAASVKYVSATGSDSNNGNTVTTPYLTIAQAQSATSGISTLVTIVVMAGTYTVTPGVATGTVDAVAGLSDNNLPRRFVCCPGQTIIQWTASGTQRDACMVDFRNSGSSLYGAKLLRDNNARTLTYATSFFNSSTAGTQQGTFYNCVFRETNANNAWSFQYDNAGTQTQKIYNCTLYAGAAGQTNWTSSSSVIFTDSVVNTTTTTGATETNVLKSQTVNSTTYVTTGVTTAGVYSGTYAWNATITTNPGLISSASSAMTGNPFTITLTTSGLANGTSVPYTISGVTSSQISNAALSGNFTMSNNSANITFTPSIYTVVYPVFSMSANTYTANVTLGPLVTITTATVLETISPTNLVPLPGQLNINHMGGNLISDPTLQSAITVKTVLSNAYLANKVIVPTTTVTTATNGPLTMYVSKPMGDTPNRESWM